MRCLSCDARLSDYEATRRCAITNEYIDLCNSCFSTIYEDMHTIERTDLAHDEDMIEVDSEEIHHCGLDIDKDY